MPYRYKARPEVLTINGKRIHVDSQNEKKLVEWFEANGFSGLWQRSEIGVAVGKSRYTNDFELSVLHNGVTKRAIVEAKPHKDALTSDIIGRMRGIASFYRTNLFLLFSRQGETWYRIDLQTGGLTDFGVPAPGLKPLHKLPKSLGLSYEVRGKHAYQRKLNPIGWLADLVIGLMQGPQPKRRRK